LAYTGGYKHLLCKLAYKGGYKHLLCKLAYKGGYEHLLCKLTYKGGYKHLSFEQMRQFLIDIQQFLYGIEKQNID
jgi:hypothetical protein